MLQVLESALMTVSVKTHYKHVLCALFNCKYIGNNDNGTYGPF